MSKIRYKEDPVKLKAQRKRYREKHREQIHLARKKYKKVNRERINILKKKHYSKHKKDILARQKMYFKFHPEMMIIKRATGRILAEMGIKRLFDAKVYIGCVPVFLKNHLEEQFKPGMNWENYGKVWNVDHIIPISYFPLKDMPELIYVASHWTNLRPMFVKEHRARKAYHVRAA